LRGRAGQKDFGQIRENATTKFGGRNWTAWFCEQIPFQEGPYKFRGLPALIFEISDNEGNINK
jgi:GLPGLI family protein